MGDAPQVSSLPMPPFQYVNLYTDENVRRGRAPRPPPPPIQDTYSMFGVPFHNDDQIIRPLESQRIKRLYPQNFDHKRELKKLNHSILVNFLDLIDILIRAPDTSKREEKIDDVNLLFIHIHHLINEFRPHQARETLRVMLDIQKRQRLETAERFQKHLDKVRELLQNALSMLPDNVEPEINDSILTEPFNESASINTKSHDNESCSTLDRLMCQIIDSL